MRAAPAALAAAQRLAGAGRLEEALRAGQAVVAADPREAEGWRLVGAVSLLLHRPEAALDALQVAHALEPDDVATLCNLGAALRALGRPREAHGRLRRAVQLAPGSATAWFNLGIVLADLSQWEEGIACQQRALLTEPRHPRAAAGLVQGLLSLGRMAEAERTARQALTWAPMLPQLHTLLAQALLGQGRMAEGWREFEWRWAASPERAAARRHADKPLWRGEPLAGRTLLVEAEQGLGDGLQSCRYLTRIVGAGRILVVLPPPLLRLLHGLEADLVLFAEGAAVPDYDLQCPMMSLPLACGAAMPQGEPPAAPYLRADPHLAATWQARLADLGDLRVGLCWASGRPPQLAGRIQAERKSLPPALLAPLGGLSGLSFVSLQRPQGTMPFPMLDPMGEVSDLADTAGLVAALDLVVSVDTAVAHLAGALGRPVWLLNRFETDWRWSGPSWYPALRQFRQTRPGDWQDVVVALEAALRERAAAGGAATSGRGAAGAGGREA